MKHGLAVILFAVLMLALVQVATDAQEETLRPIQQYPVSRWDWPPNIDQKARLVSTETIGNVGGLPATVVLTFQEPSGAVKIVIVKTDVIPGKLAPQSYRIISIGR